MVKTRMTGIDIGALVAEMRQCIGMRVANVYDVNAKTYLFKLALPDTPKTFILVESGIRMHATSFMRDKPNVPSGFTVKLRKHIRTRRLEDVRQLGVDRVVDMQLGTGEAAYHVIIELYASGNIILSTVTTRFSTSYANTHQTRLTSIT